MRLDHCPLSQARLGAYGLEERFDYQGPRERVSFGIPVGDPLAIFGGSIAQPTRFFPPFLEQGPHPFPFRTRKLSPASAMVLQSFLCGRVARRWDLLSGVVSASRAISTGQLHALLRFHLQPINLLVLEGP